MQYQMVPLILTFLALGSMANAVASNIVNNERLSQVEHELEEVESLEPIPPVGVLVYTDHVTYPILNCLVDDPRAEYDFVYRLNRHVVPLGRSIPGPPPPSHIPSRVGFEKEFTLRHLLNIARGAVNSYPDSQRHHDIIMWFIEHDLKDELKKYQKEELFDFFSALLSQGVKVYARKLDALRNYGTKYKRLQALMEEFTRSQTQEKVITYFQLACASSYVTERLRHSGIKSIREIENRLYAQIDFLTQLYRETKLRKGKKVKLRFKPPGWPTQFEKKKDYMDLVLSLLGYFRRTAPLDPHYDILPHLLYFGPEYATLEEKLEAEEKFKEIVKITFELWHVDPLLFKAQNIAAWFGERFEHLKERIPFS